MYMFCIVVYSFDYSIIRDSILCEQGENSPYIIQMNCQHSLRRYFQIKVNENRRNRTRSNR